VAEMKEYILKATEGCKPFVAFCISITSYILFPKQGFLTAFRSVIGAMLLDILTKYVALSHESGGFRQAIITKNIYSKNLWEGTKIKIYSYLIVFILAGLSYRVAPISNVSVFLATTIYTVLFLREAQSIVENLIDAGADLNWLLAFTKNKEKEILKNKNND
jgi:uncharacterized membrane protein